MLFRRYPSRQNSLFRGIIRCPAGFCLALGGMVVSMAAGYAAGKVFEELCKHGEEIIEKSKGFIADKLTKLDSDLTSEEAQSMDRMLLRVSLTM